jgi:Uma2 family endonuclease
MTVEEFAALPEDGQMHELVEGELLTMPPPHFLHADIVALIHRSLLLFLETAGIGRVFAEAGFLLSESPPTVRQPDLSVLTAERLAARPSEGYYRGAPDVAIEVLSPSDSADDLHLKIRQYLAAGANAVIVVSPRAREVWIHRAQGSPESFGAGQTVELPDLLPGWSLPLADLFAPLDRR